MAKEGSFNRRAEIGTLASVPLRGTRKAIIRERACREGYICINADRGR